MIGSIHGGVFGSSVSALIRRDFIDNCGEARHENDAILAVAQKQHQYDGTSPASNFNGKSSEHESKSNKGKLLRQTKFCQAFMLLLLVLYLGALSILNVFHADKNNASTMKIVITKNRYWREGKNHGRRLRSLHWHEYLDHTSGKHYYSNGINTTWNAPSECLPFGCNGDDDEKVMEKEIISENIHATNSTKNQLEPKLPPWIQSNLANVKDSPMIIDRHEKNKTNRSTISETPFFWHIPKAAGTAIQHLYWCLNLTLANEVGANPKFAHDQDTILVEFLPFSPRNYHVVNVDTTTQKGILRAKTMGLASSTNPMVDLVVSGELPFAAQHLFDSSHRGRVISMFRHPVDRAVSMFYYLRNAEWEPTYKAKWKAMTITEWANGKQGEHSWMVRKLVGKESDPDVTMEDLDLAKEIIRTKMLVGLNSNFIEIIHRFNAYLGIDDSSTRQQRECMSGFAGKPADKDEAKAKEYNYDQHPMLEKGSAEWDLLADKNLMDVLLYEYVEAVFHEQREYFDVLKMEDSS